MTDDLAFLLPRLLSSRRSCITRTPFPATHSLLHKNPRNRKDVAAESEERTFGEIMHRSVSHNININFHDRRFLSLTSCTPFITFAFSLPLSSSPALVPRPSLLRPLRHTHALSDGNHGGKMSLLPQPLAAARDTKANKGFPLLMSPSCSRRSNAGREIEEEE